ncbi:hypothetical protein [Nitrospira sp. Ecomares 2.1]
MAEEIRASSSVDLYTPIWLKVEPTKRSGQLLLEQKNAYEVRGEMLNEKYIPVYLRNANEKIGVNR